MKSRQSIEPMTTTTLYLGAQDRQNIRGIRDKYRFRSDAEAVRWALAVVNAQNVAVLVQFRNSVQ